MLCSKQLSSKRTGMTPLILDSTTSVAPAGQRPETSQPTAKPWGTSLNRKMEDLRQFWGLCLRLQLTAIRFFGLGIGLQTTATRFFRWGNGMQRDAGRFGGWGRGAQVGAGRFFGRWVGTRAGAGRFGGCGSGGRVAAGWFPGWGNGWRWLETRFLRSRNGREMRVGRFLGLLFDLIFTANQPQ